MRDKALKRPGLEVIQDAIDEFAKSIGSTHVKLIHHQPHPRASHTRCVDNVIAISHANGGKHCLGWHFILRPTPQNGWYLIATHHAVWRDTRDNSLLDVTPLHPDPLNQPLGNPAYIVFLEDPAATLLKVRVDGDEVSVVRPLKFLPVSKDDETFRYVAGRNAAELELFNSQFPGNAFT